MPRRTTIAAPAAPAEEHANGFSAELGDLDEHGLERLPFPSKPETCDALSAWGVRCTLAIHSGSHSWGGETSDSGASNEVEESEQPALPGTPEPDDQGDYHVPTEAQFNKRDLMAAPGLQAIAERLISEDDSFDHLSGIRIDYFWRRRGGTQGGNPKFGGIKRPGLYESYLTSGEVVYFVALAADHVRDARFSHEQVEACLHDLLCRTDVDPDDHDAYRIIAPDFSGSIRTLKRFGAWSPDLREAAFNMQQLPLIDAPALPAANEGEDDEGEADE